MVEPHLAHRSVAPRERAAIALQRGEIRARAEREHHIEKASPLHRRTRHEHGVARREDHRGERAQRIRHALGLRTVQKNFLAAAEPVEADGDVVRARAFDRRRQMKARLAEGDELRVLRAAQRSQQTQIVDRFEEVRLPLAVLADQRDPRRRQLELRPTKIAEGANRQPPQRAVRDRMLGDRAHRAHHSPVNAAGRFARNALIPSFMSFVVAIRPK